MGSVDLGHKVLFRAGRNLIFCVPDLIRGHRVNLRIRLFVSDVNQENENFGYKVGSRFYCVASGMERFSKDLLRAVVLITSAKSRSPRGISPATFQG